MSEEGGKEEEEEMGERILAVPYSSFLSIYIIFLLWRILVDCVGRRNIKRSWKERKGERKSKKKKVSLKMYIRKVDECEMEGNISRGMKKGLRRKE